MDGSQVPTAPVALGWTICGAAGWRIPAWLCDRPDLLRLAELQYRPRPAEDRAVLVCAGALTNQAGWERVAPPAWKSRVAEATGCCPAHPPRRRSRMSACSQRRCGTYLRA